MCCVSIIILTTLFAVTFSQLTISVDNSNVGAGGTVVFTCTVTNFLDNVFVLQGTANRVFCIVGDSCATTDDSIYTVTTSGTTITFTINSFLKSRDVGSWVVRYGSTDSSPVTLSAAIESEVTTEGPIKGSPSSENKDYGPAIAGGVVGGVIVILIIYLIWRKWPRGPQSPQTPPRDSPTQPTPERSTQEAVIGKPVVLLPNLSKSYHSVQYKSVQWTHNDEPVSTDKDNAYKGGKKSSPSLEISSVSEEDFGLWKCILESENSKQVFVVQLKTGSIHSTLYNLPPI